MMHCCVGQWQWGVMWCVGILWGRRWLVLRGWNTVCCGVAMGALDSGCEYGVRVRGVVQCVWLS